MVPLPSALKAVTVRTTPVAAGQDSTMLLPVFVADREVGGAGTVGAGPRTACIASTYAPCPVLLAHSVAVSTPVASIHSFQVVVIRNRTFAAFIALRSVV